MKKTIAAIFILFSLCSFADEVFRIEIGRDYSKYSNRELKERLWRLEKAVWQLQQKVFHLENTASAPSEPKDTWVCTLKAMSDLFTATGTSKALAKAAVIEKCTTKQGDGFFCKNPKCEK